MPFSLFTLRGGGPCGASEAVASRSHTLLDDQVKMESCLMTTLVISGLYVTLSAARAARGALTTTVWKISFAQAITRGRTVEASRRVKFHLITVKVKISS
jgi:hypothetical protein